MIPVDAGFIKYESLKDGTIDLEDIALMHEWLEIKAENERRADEARKRG